MTGFDMTTEFQNSVNARKTKLGHDWCEKILVFQAMQYIGAHRFSIQSTVISILVVISGEYTGLTLIHTHSSFETNSMSNPCFEMSSGHELMFLDDPTSQDR